MTTPTPPKSPPAPTSFRSGAALPRGAGSATDLAAGLRVDAGADLARSSGAAEATAAVFAEYQFAALHRRDLLDFRARMLAEAERPRFADVAEYELPRNAWNSETRSYEKTIIRGPSVHVARAALRHYRNLRVSARQIYDDAERRVVRVGARDLETNTPVEFDVVVPKTIERKKLRSGQDPLSERTNSEGKIVYTVAASEDELRTTEARLVALALRNAVFHLVPGDIIEETVMAARATSEREFGENPEKWRAKMLARFDGVGVGAEKLALWLGHSVETTTLSEGRRLLSLLSAIENGEATFAASLEERLEERRGSAPTTTTDDASDAKPKAATKPKTVDELVAKRAAAKSTPAPVAAPPAPDPAPPTDAAEDSEAAPADEPVADSVDEPAPPPEKKAASTTDAPSRASVVRAISAKRKVDPDVDLAVAAFLEERGKRSLAELSPEALAAIAAEVRVA